MTRGKSWIPGLVMMALVAAPPAGAVGQAAGQAHDVELVGDGTISTGRNETFPAEDPVDGDLWFSVYEDGFDAQTIMVARRTASGWATPVTAPFSGRWGDRAPRFSPDGRTLYFTSNRPVDADADAAGDMNIWRAQRTTDGWDAPEIVPPGVNSGARDIHAAVTDRAVWVASNRDGGFGRSDLFRVPGGGEAEHLPAPLNDAYSQPDLWVSPDEAWMVLVITDHPSGYGGDDLYVSRREAGGWTIPRNLGPGINSEEYEYGPSLSKDGRYLYFTSHRRGSADIYRVPVEPLASRDD
jgi:hypothetical protein